MSATVTRWLREPLVQFLLIGGALFAVWQALNPGDARETRRIELTQDDLRQMTVSWLAQGRPVPSPEQMQGLIENKVREEILYREALKLGLDQDDTIVKRRLAQKMEFLADDTVALRDPTRDELQTWFAANQERFKTPARVTFRHVYYSMDRRGARARDAAAAALASSRAITPKTVPAGDPFMFQDRFGDRTPEQVASLFGPAFSAALFRLSPGTWQGPIESGYGWHLVRVDSLEPAKTPPFEEAEDAIRETWIAEQRAANKRRVFDAMRARYEVIVPAAVDDKVAAMRPESDSAPVR